MLLNVFTDVFSYYKYYNLINHRNRWCFILINEKSQESISGYHGNIIFFV